MLSLTTNQVNALSARTISIALMKRMYSVTFKRFGIHAIQQQDYHHSHDLAGLSLKMKF